MVEAFWKSLLNFKETYPRVLCDSKVGRFAEAFAFPLLCVTYFVVTGARLNVRLLEEVGLVSSPVLEISTDLRASEQWGRLVFFFLLKSLFVGGLACWGTILLVQPGRTGGGRHERSAFRWVLKDAVVIALLFYGLLGLIASQEFPQLDSEHPLIFVTCLVWSLYLGALEVHSYHG